MLKSTLTKDTGALASLIRYKEGQNKNCLFKDSYAERFINKESVSMFNEKMLLYPYFQQLFTVRHRLFIDEVQKYLKEDNGISQLLSIGSGYCSMIHDIISDNPGIKGFEVDRKQIMDRKISILKNQYLPTLISCDLISQRDEFIHEVLNSGFNKNKHSIIFMEGLLYYMPDFKFIRSFLNDISSIIPDGSFLIFDMQIGSGSYTKDETDFANIFEELSTWASMLEEIGLPILKYGNISFLDNWNRLTEYKGRVRSSIFVTGKYIENMR